MRTIDWNTIPAVDILCGGPPCQPFSCAGKRLGAEDDRNLWPETLAAVTELRPRWIFFENVPGVLAYLVESVLPALEGLGYTNTPHGEIVPLVIPACSVDAPQLRYRVWLVAHTNRDSLRLQPGGTESRRTDSDEPRDDGTNRTLADPQGLGAGHGHDSNVETERAGESEGRDCISPSGSRSWWPTEPAICRVGYGIPNRVDRLRGLGNAIVPQIAEALGRMILEVS